MPDFFASKLILHLWLTSISFLECYFKDYGAVSVISGRMQWLISSACNGGRRENEGKQAMYFSYLN